MARQLLLCAMPKHGTLLRKRKRKQEFGQRTAPAQTGTTPGSSVRAEPSPKFLHLSTKTDGRQLQLGFSFFPVIYHTNWKFTFCVLLTLWPDQRNDTAAKHTEVGMYQPHKQAGHRQCLHWKKYNCFCDGFYSFQVKTTAEVTQAAFTKASGKTVK